MPVIAKGNQFAPLQRPITVLASGRYTNAINIDKPRIPMPRKSVAGSLPWNPISPQSEHTRALSRTSGQLKDLNQIRYNSRLKTARIANNFKKCQEIQLIFTSFFIECATLCKGCQASDHKRRSILSWWSFLLSYAIAAWRLISAKGGIRYATTYKKALTMPFAH